MANWILSEWVYSADKSITRYLSRITVQLRPRNHVGRKFTITTDTRARARARVRVRGNTQDDLFAVNLFTV